MKSALSCPAKLPLPGTVLHRGQREVKSPECTGKKAGEGCLKRPGPVLSHLLNTYMDTHTCTHTHTHMHTHTHTHTHAHTHIHLYHSLAIKEIFHSCLKLF